MHATALGIIIMLVATSLTNIGAVLQKRGVDDLPPFEAAPLLDSIRGVLRTKVWVAGWLMGITGIGLNMLALGLADISLIQPLNGFGLVVLALFSRLYLGERLDGPTVGGIGLVIAGVVVVGVTVPESRVFTHADEIVASFTHASALVTMLAFALGIALLALMANRFGAHAGIVFAFVAAACSVTGLTFSKGFFGLATTVGLGPTLSLGPAWLLFGLMIAFSLTAMVIQQLSFQKGRAVVVTPVFGATSVALPLLTGALVFGERLAGWSLLAPVLILAGVVLLGRRPTADSVPQPAAV